ncbi:hypothetical protein [Streptococcus sp. S784/96/1]|uniref:hypothetical protein n=1 Tax=Streptococcus sp. S784/96/1 TaxID=2653499 RepID=UPI0013873F85|nr:hypothetical protein [Streptococcus sp. S784/96/1]
MGRDFDGNVGLHIRDSKDQTRIKMVVDKEDQTVIQFLNKEGKVTFSLNPDDLIN